MSYTPSTVAASANCAKDAMDAWDPLITAAGFTFIETYTSGSDVTTVYKSAIGDNGEADWWLFMRRNTDSSTSVKFCVSEAYNSSTHKVTKYPVASSGTPAAPGHWTNDTTGVFPNSASMNWNYCNVSVGTAGTAYWLTVTTTRLIIGTRVSGTDSGCYAGIADETVNIAVEGARAFMVVATPLSSSVGGVTTEPAITTSNSYNFQIYVKLYTTLTSTTNDIYTGNRNSCPWAITPNRDASGTVRGFLRDVLYTSFSGMTNGDTLTIGTDVYTCVWGANHAWAKQA